MVMTQIFSTQSLLPEKCNTIDDYSYNYAFFFRFSVEGKERNVRVQMRHDDCLLIRSPWILFLCLPLGLGSNTIGD